MVFVGTKVQIEQMLRLLVGIKNLALSKFLHLPTGRSHKSGIRSFKRMCRTIHSMTKAMSALDAGRVLELLQPVKMNGLAAGAAVKKQNAVFTFEISTSPRLYISCLVACQRLYFLQKIARLKWHRNNLPQVVFNSLGH